jgi:hypothetical protein
MKTQSASSVKSTRRLKLARTPEGLLTGIPAPLRASSGHLSLPPKIFYEPFQGPMLWSFKYIRRKNLAKILAFLTQNRAKLCKSLIITLVFDKKRPFFRQKLMEIAENCNHNIDPKCKVILSELAMPKRKLNNKKMFTLMSISNFPLGSVGSNPPRV